MLRAFGFSDKGRVRPTNEDRFSIDDRLRLCVIADGMGGHNAGEVAAGMVVEAVTDHVRSFGDRARGADDTWPFGFDPSLSPEGNLLRTAVHIAHLRILEAAGAAQELAGMGTTIVAALERGGRLSVAYVGDSRLYICSPCGLRQVTHDDSWVAAILASDPSADPVMLQQHPLRNALTNVVGARAGTRVHVVEETLAHGALILLTTDGVHGVLDHGRMESFAREAGQKGDASPLPAQLVGAAISSGTRDNCTVVAAVYTEAGVKPPD